MLTYLKTVMSFGSKVKSNDSAKRIGHPAPFPVELPRRSIEFYTYAGDVVLDPFIGAGSTALAALNTGRFFVGFDISQDYIDLANNRIHENHES